MCIRDRHRVALQREVSQVRHTKMSTLHKHHLDLQVRSEQTSNALHFAQELLSEASDIEVWAINTKLQFNVSYFEYYIIRKYKNLFLFCSY